MADYPAELVKQWQGGGETLIIRPIRPDDAREHEAFFHRLPPEDVRLRFFSLRRELTPAQLAKFTRPDYERDMALIAVREMTGETVGVARLMREKDPLVGEFAVVVQPDMQGKGLATHMLQVLFDWARMHGVREVVGEMLPENERMLRLARHIGFLLRQAPGDPGIIEARLALAPPG